MSRQFEWPETSREIPGLMGFSAEWDDHSAADYKRWLEPKVNALLRELDQQDAQLVKQRTQEQDLEIKLEKLRASLVKHDELCVNGQEFGAKYIEVFMDTAEECLRGGGKVRIRMTPKGLEYEIEYKTTPDALPRA